MKHLANLVADIRYAGAVPSQVQFAGGGDIIRWTYGDMHGFMIPSAGIATVYREDLQQHICLPPSPDDFTALGPEDRGCTITQIQHRIEEAQNARP